MAASPVGLKVECGKLLKTVQDKNVCLWDLLILKRKGRGEFNTKNNGGNMVTQPHQNKTKQNKNPCS